MNDDVSKGDSRTVNSTTGTCCSDKGSSCGCENRRVCSPCLVVWGIVLAAMLVSYFLR